MGDPVQQGHGQGFILEELSPFSEGQVGGDHEGDPVVNGSAELEEQLGTLLGEGDETQFINDDELLAQRGLNEPWHLQLFLGDQQLIDQASGRVEADSSPLPTSRQSQRRCDMGFSSAIEMTS